MTTARLAAHVLREKRAFNGQSYPGRLTEHVWASANLPQTKADFDAVISTVRAMAEWVPLPVEIAALLLNIAERNVDAHPLSRIWMPPAPAKKTSGKACVRCGSPAVSRATAGWACVSHYDTLS